MYAESEKGHTRERNETHENTAHSARTRRRHCPTRTAAAACGCLPTERCTTGKLGCSVFQLSSLWHRLITKSQRATMFSSKTPESAEGSSWPSVRTHFSLRQVHVVLPRPARTASSSPRTTPRRPPCALSRAPTPRREVAARDNVLVEDARV